MLLTVADVSLLLSPPILGAAIGIVMGLATVLAAVGPRQMAHLSGVHRWCRRGRCA